LKFKFYIKIDIKTAPTNFGAVTSELSQKTILNFILKFKFYIKINIKTAPTYFGAITPSSGTALLVIAKVTVVKIAN
jgi:hypothetical protein